MSTLAVGAPSHNLVLPSPHARTTSRNSSRQPGRIAEAIVRPQKPGRSCSRWPPLCTPPWSSGPKPNRVHSICPSYIHPSLPIRPPDTLSLPKPVRLSNPIRPLPSSVLLVGPGLRNLSDSVPLKCPALPTLPCPAPPPTLRPSRPLSTISGVGNQFGNRHESHFAAALGGWTHFETLVGNRLGITTHPPLLLLLFYHRHCLWRRESNWELP